MLSIRRISEIFSTKFTWRKFIIPHTRNFSLCPHFVHCHSDVDPAFIMPFTMDPKTPISFLLNLRLIFLIANEKKFIFDSFAIRLSLST